MKKDSAKDIKIAFFDVDGTLVDMEKKVITPAMIETLKHLKENPGESGKPGTAGLHPHFTFFHSIGKEQGMMLAVTFERLCIQTQAEVVCIDNPVFAFSFETSAFGKEYEVLLNSRLL